MGLKLLFSPQKKLMLRTRWRKVFLDLLGNKTRTALVVSAIAVGVFSIGFISSTYEILIRELNRDYVAANVASGRLITMPFNQDLVERIAKMEGIAAAEGGRTVRVRVATVRDEWQDILLSAVPEDGVMELDKVTPLEGKWPPGRGELVLERLSPEYIHHTIGDTITVELADGTRKELHIVGIVHDSQRISASMTNFASGYVTLDTMNQLGLGEYYNEMRFTAAEKRDDPTHVINLVKQVEKQLEDSGREVFSTATPPPGDHPAGEFIDTLILIFTVFGFLILCLASLLVVNTISALLAQQVKQIGIMKLVGAQRNQIVWMYGVMISLYSLAALAVAIPLAVYVAQRIMTDIVEDLLNIMPESYGVSLSVVALQAGVGLFIPLGAALWPVFSTVRVTTQQALSNTGLEAGAYGQSLSDRLFFALQRWFNFQRPLLISARNTMRRKGRLALTLTTLVMGTALFIAVLSVRASVNLTLANFLRYHQYDVSLTLGRMYRTEQLAQVVESWPAVVEFEAWSTGSVERIRPAGFEQLVRENVGGVRGVGQSFRASSGRSRFTLYAVPPHSQTINPAVEEGRWLLPADENGLVVNSDVVDEEPDIQLGSTVILDVNGRETEWVVVGIVPTESKGPIVYVNYDYYAYLTRTTGQSNHVRVIANEHTAPAQDQLRSDLVAQLGAAGFQVGNTRTSTALEASNELTFNIVIAFLILMAVLLAIVGGLGLTTTMSINVLERIREIGVLRAIGASNQAVRQIILAEGILIGLLSWFIGVAISWPVSLFLSERVGMALLGIPLNFTYSAWSAAGWFVAILVIAAVASLGPAENASRLTIREVLAYE